MDSPPVTSNADTLSDDESDFDQGPCPEFLKSGQHIVYCPVCSMPPEYCEFNPKKIFNQCKPWLMKNYPDLYPHLFEEEKKLQKKAKKPKGQFFGWYDIGLFHQMRAALAEARQKAESKLSPSTSTGEPTPSSSQPLDGDESVITFRGKIKLHGTNGAISIQHNGSEVYVQSRNTFITKETDHHGFAHWALKTENKEYFKSLFQKSAGYKALTIFGEYCGKGIMKGAAICQLDRTIFAVFAILMDKDRLIIDPAHIEEILNGSNMSKKKPEALMVIPWLTPEFVLPMWDKEVLLSQIEEINKLVEEVDREDPWVKQVFGISGIGEGLVWYPVSYQCNGTIELSKLRSLIFKTKGPTHSVVTSRKSIQIAPEVLDSAEAFVDMFVTEQRLHQGFEEVCRQRRRRQKEISEKITKERTEEEEEEEEYEEDTTLDLQKIGDFVHWVCKDVEKESEAERKESNLQWSQVSGLVNLKARKWFLGELNKRGGVVVPLDESEALVIKEETKDKADDPKGKGDRKSVV